MGSLASSELPYRMGIVVVGVGSRSLDFVGFALGPLGHMPCLAAKRAVLGSPMWGYLRAGGGDRVQLAKKYLVSRTPQPLVMLP